MEKQVGQTLSLLTLLPEGKVENEVRITETAITGVCTVYAKRSDSDNEFLLRTIGVAAPDGCTLTEAAEIATRQAYISAMSQIAGVAGIVMLQPQSKKAQPTPEVKPPSQPREPQEENKPAPSPAVNAVESESKPPPADLKSVVVFPEVADDSPGESGNSLPFGDGEILGQNPGGGIEKIEFADSLFPGSETINVSVGTDDGNDDPEYQKALDTEITIFGKLNGCNGWKAGKILAEMPDMIIDFCNRNSNSHDGPKYTGPKTDQKEALFKLYPEAVRKVHKSA